ncbi:hypothetical protein SDC9_68124 [bioreactor metagenome]|uniref:Uncharacterized protein n=1 Tax=bioreactor metagenome TaxID=1076179 RepID=A0A644XZZ6_9ZZZZ
MVSHADSENRFSGLHCFSDVVYGWRTESRVTGTVGNKQSVELHLVKIVIPGYAHDCRIPFQQAADDVVFHTAIDQYHFVLSAAVDNHLLAACFCNLIFVIGIHKRYIGFTRKDQFTKHCPFFPDQLGQFARVDAVDGRYFVFLQPVA